MRSPAREGSPACVALMLPALIPFEVISFVEHKVGLWEVVVEEGLVDESRFPMRLPRRTLLLKL